jgi:ribosomal protein S18 acetylase RimI-like enzyme
LLFTLLDAKLPVPSPFGPMTELQIGVNRGEESGVLNLRFSTTSFITLDDENLLENLSAMFLPQEIPSDYSGALSLDEIGDGELMAIAHAASREIGAEHVSEGTGETFFARSWDHVVYIQHLGVTVAILVWFQWVEGNAAWIGTVWTHPDHRRRGLYRQMYTQAKTEARNKGLKYIACGVTGSNVLSRATHTALGMLEQQVTFQERL